MQIKILYEDAGIVAIDKPSGLSIDEISARYPEYVLAHRLDKETSGVLLLAKNEKAHLHLKIQFQGREIKKTYIAIVQGWPKNNGGIIDKPIGRSPADPRRRLAGRGVKGKLREAITEYKVLKRFSAENEEQFSLLEVSPRTGRTHQIRVHLKYAGYPIICDKLYNPKGPCPIGRMALHARVIEFQNTESKMIKVESPLPNEFNSL